jgi:diguanylate cyclase (GGDEF)-like protein
MLQLLARIEAISSCRDRETLAAMMADALHEFLVPRALVFFRLVQRDERFWLEPQASHDAAGILLGSAAASGAGGIPLEWQPLVAAALRSGDAAMRDDASGVSFAFPLCLHNATQPYGFFCFNFADDPAQDTREALVWVLRFYANYLSLLDYSELDTLTGLLNRKTFDELFERLVTADASGAVAQSGKERRAAAADDSVWLAVVDLDHFKRINDNFGHLFGDEVLLRLGNLMRAVFRKQDLLFRFGGEEFVVVLRPTLGYDASPAFERFRAAVEAHEFPQVGRVTCSLGYVRVQADVMPTELLGRADRALYYAKNNGRNQVCGYEDLVAQGLLEEAGAAVTDIDIDALFG